MGERKNGEIMSKIKPAKLTLEDFKEQREWIGPLFSILNGFTGDLVAALNNGLTVEDNLRQEIKEIKFKNSSSDYPVKFKAKFNLNPKGMYPIYFYNNTLSAYSTQTPWVEWSYSDGLISISNVSGLTADSQYTIRLLVVYG